tara:strand:- start:913 stop:1338 length:426 start_codon:yes stop_codon:yes gene_type:complete
MNKKKIKKYLLLFENLEISNINQFDELIDKNIIFIDPFNKVIGNENFKKVFKNSLQKINGPKFKVLQIISKKNIYFVKWKMNYKAFGKKQEIIGLSEIGLNNSGLIKFHYDYWDSYSQFYTKIPIIGKIFLIFLNFIKTKI